jgi:hypothetical protein
VGRFVPAGLHDVSFEYVPFPRYDALLGIGVATFLALVFVSRRLGRRTDPDGRLMDTDPVT